MTHQARIDQAGSAPPGPAVAHELGTTDDCLSLMEGWFREHGDTYRVFVPSRDAWAWVIHHPDDVRRVLVGNHRNYTKGCGMDRIRLLLGDGIMTSEGAQWRRHRRLMQPAFHRKGMERFAATIRRCNAELLERWESACASGEPVNVTQAMSEFALTVILNLIFGDDLPRLVRDLHDNPFMLVARQPRRDAGFAYQFRQLSRHVLDIVRARSASGSPGHDLTGMLLEAADPETGSRMSEREIVDEVLTLVVAGHETTAASLAWTWSLLSRHPDAQERAHEEQARAGDVGCVDFTGLDRLPYTRQVIAESLRLYPPGWLLPRRAIGPDRLGGYDVPPGTDVFLSPFLIHRHPGFWDEPEAFRPERFASGVADARQRWCYLPFGAGPRHCIGENLSMYEMMLHLNGALRRFRLSAVDGRPPGLEARINLRAANDIHLRVEKR